MIYVTELQFFSTTDSDAQIRQTPDIAHAGPELMKIVLFGVILLRPKTDNPKRRQAYRVFK